MKVELIACLFIDGTMPLLSDIVKISSSGWAISYNIMWVLRRDLTGVKGWMDW